MKHTYLTLAEAAARLRIHRNTAERLVRSGELAAVRVGRQWRIPMSAIAAPLVVPA